MSLNVFRVAWPMSLLDLRERGVLESDDFLCVCFIQEEVEEGEIEEKKEERTESLFRGTYIYRHWGEYIFWLWLDWDDMVFLEGWVYC